MENNEALFEQVTAPQEAVLDAKVSRGFDTICCHLKIKILI